MSDTPNLNLPYMLAAQAQKHVTHNEALRMLDAVVQLSVLDRNLAAPPGSPVNGDRYIVAASPSGAWAGQAEKIAAFQDGAWAFYAPKEGWLAWIADENVVAAFDGVGWAVISGGGGGGTSDHGLLVGLGDDDHAQYHNNARGDARYTPLAPTTLGVNATADATNRLAVAALATLFNHAGNGHQVKVNKNAAADTASLLFQTGFSGRAEFGTTGDDDFHLKVSPNGSTFYEAVVVDRATGRVALPNTPRSVLRNYTSSATWTKPAGLVKIRVWGVGPGGSTPSSTAAAAECAPGAGGGSGAYGFKEILAASLGATESVTIGAPVAGSDGGTTSFASHLTLPGGGGGATMASGTSITQQAGSVAAAATGADWTVPGQYGERGVRWSGTQAQGGRGCSSPLGSGGMAGVSGSSGSPGTGYGAGAGGPCANSATTRNGALGAPSILFVEEFY